jgi:hypothetical protein
MLMFSDRARLPKMLLSATLLGMLCWHFAERSISHEAGYPAALRSPQAKNGVPLVFPLWSVTHIRNANMYEISKTVLGVPIQGRSEGLSVGDTVTIQGHFRARDRVVVAASRVDHPWRAAKGVLSLCALIIALLLVPRRFGLKGGRVVLRG